MADLSDYKELDGIEFRPEVKKLMQIFADSWDECRADNCSECKYRHGKQMYRMLICMSERYAENLLSADVAPVRHGYWRPILHVGGKTDYECSCCLGIIADVPDDDEHDLCAWCSMCGAKMDGAAHAPD